MLLQRELCDDQIYLSTLNEDDPLDEYLSWMHDQDIVAHLEARFGQHSRESLASFIKGCRESVSDLLCGINLNEGQRHIGNIKLGALDHNHKRAEIGLLIGARDQWGKGIATRAVSLLSQYALRDLELYKVWAGAYSNNPASVRAFIKAGYTEVAVIPEHFHTDGEWVGLVIMQMCATDLPAQSARQINR